MTTKTAADYRIEQVQKIHLNGRPVKMFRAFERQGDAFVFCGQFDAPVKTANKNLWQIAANREAV